MRVHGIDAWRDAAAGRAGTRNHFPAGRRAGNRRADALALFRRKIAGRPGGGGFDYDSTVGYNRTVGYRAGTTQVFKPLTTMKLLELPLHVMDTALFYPSLPESAPAQAEETVRPLIANAARFGGVLTVNWHDRSVAPERLWDTAYVRLLEQLRSSGACFLTAARTVAWFRRRRAAVFEQAGGDRQDQTPGRDGRPPARPARPEFSAGCRRREVFGNTAARWRGNLPGGLNPNQKGKS